MVNKPLFCKYAMHQMPRIRTFLLSVMNPLTKAALDQIETHVKTGSLTNKPVYPFLVVLRAAIDKQLMYNFWVRHGMAMLLDATKLTTADLLNAAKNPAMLMRYGIRKRTEPLAVLVDIIKALDKPATRQMLVGATNERVQKHRADQEKRLREYMTARLKRKAVCYKCGVKSVGRDPKNGKSLCRRHLKEIRESQPVPVAKPRRVDIDSGL